NRLPRLGPAVNGARLVQRAERSRARSRDPREAGLSSDGSAGGRFERLWPADERAVVRGHAASGAPNADEFQGLELGGLEISPTSERAIDPERARVGAACDDPVVSGVGRRVVDGVAP